MCLTSLFLLIYDIIVLGVRTEQDLYIRLIDSVTKEVKYFYALLFNLQKQKNKYTVCSTNDCIYPHLLHFLR